MKSKWARAHWTMGTLTLMLFPFAGLYMRFVADVPHLSDAPRLMFRSRFLFLLLIAIVNLALSYEESHRFTAVRLALCSVRRDFSPLHPKTMAL